MKPFDLEQAKAGKPVVIRNGTPIQQLTFFKCHNIYCIGGVVNNEIEHWDIEGKYLMSMHEHPYDLFMAPETKTVWVNVYKNSNGNIWIGNPMKLNKVPKRIQSLIINI